MPALMLRKIHALYFYIILFHSLKPTIATGIYFKVITDTDEGKSVGDTTPLIRKEIYQCGREQSCTHVMKLASGYLTVRGSNELEKRKHQAERVYEKMTLPARSCLDIYHIGVRENGQYEVFDQNDIPYKVFCDFESEANSVWTLVNSYSLKNKNAHRKPFYISDPRNERSPNWKDYRLGFPRMKNIRSSSTMWRATCSFSKYKSDIYLDYMRVKFDDADILEFKCLQCCYPMEYINIRGHKGFGIKGALWQGDTMPLHVDSSRGSCTFDAREGSIEDEDNFGHYLTINRAFKCTETDESTTQYWFGVNI